MLAVIVPYSVTDALKPLFESHYNGRYYNQGVEDKVLRRICGHTEDRKNYIMRFIVYVSLPHIVKLLNQGEYDLRDMLQARGDDKHI
jgi:hypothetical protein